MFFRIVLEGGLGLVSTVLKLQEKRQKITARENATKVEGAESKIRPGGAICPEVGVAERPRSVGLRGVADCWSLSSLFGSGGGRVIEVSKFVGQIDRDFPKAGSR